jgi:hypothetical protein
LPLHHSVLQTRKGQIAAIRHRQVHGFLQRQPPRRRTFLRATREGTTETKHEQSQQAGPSQRKPPAQAFAISHAHFLAPAFQ